MFDPCVWMLPPKVFLIWLSLVCCNSMRSGPAVMVLTIGLGMFGLLPKWK